MSRPRQELCCSGRHPMALTRHPKYGCYECHLERGRERWPGPGYLSTRPLRPFLRRDFALTAYASRFGVQRDSARQARDRLLRQDWVSEETADRWCVALDLHLDLLWSLRNGPSQLQRERGGE